MKFIGTGVDITEVKRLREAVDRWGEAFLTRIFTPNELKNAAGRVNLYQHLAGRFAAKEAVFKALGDPQLNWQDVEILNDKDGKPWCSLLNGRGKSKEILISISHVKNYAVANALVTEKS